MISRWLRKHFFKESEVKDFAFVYPSAYGFVPVRILGDGLYSAVHPRANHTFVTTARDKHEFIFKMIRHFDALSVHGGSFDRIYGGQWMEFL
jgi:hypothetical protein